MLRNVFLGSILVLAFLKEVRSQTITSIDFVQIVNGHRAEAIYFYDNNWKVYREEALKKGYIRSYQLLEVQPDSLSNYQLMLLTEYHDQTVYDRREENFQKIIKELRPDGAKLLNELKPDLFRKVVYFKLTQTLAGDHATEISERRR